MVVLFSNARFPGFGWRCSSAKLSARCFFGQVRMTRSHIACVTLAGFGNSDFVVSLPRMTRSLRLHPAESSRVRARAFPLRLSVSLPRFGLRRHPPPPNKSFKPTPHRGINSVLCATLHAVAAPLRGGLTPALGCMNQDNDQFIYITWAIQATIALVILSGLYPAKKLYASTKRTAKTAFWIITGLATAAPSLYFIYDRLRLYMLELNNPPVLKYFRIPIDWLPYLYIQSAIVAALLFWVIFAWHSRTAA